MSSNKYFAIDCEMVGARENVHMLARVSIVDRDGNCIYDKFVKPQEEVLNYRTAVSGIRPEDLSTGEEFHTVSREVKEILKDCILIGHGLYFDFKVLKLRHPKHMIRDTALYKPFRKFTGGKTPSLKLLAKEILNKQIQTGEHSSIEDACAAMQIYLLHEEEWEKAIEA
ncbi:RNA exonuclease 4-like [Ctenocephalides felis]|uniref:RNA exonuclease 4-like n=1 Tax=Ctenocephalides felis TaxID=7515 RepID=UPI000E6E2FD3|nr:RNA exonuclease 4-like [Ctenocephalides felis]